MKKTNQEAFIRYYKIIYMLEAAKLEMEFLNSKDINFSIYDKTISVYKKINQLKAELNNKSNGNYDKIFESVSNEKIYCMLSVIQKMIFLTEEQALALEKMIQLDFKEDKDIKNVK